MSGRFPCFFIPRQARGQMGVSHRWSRAALRLRANMAEALESCPRSPVALFALDRAVRRLARVFREGGVFERLIERKPVGADAAGALASLSFSLCPLVLAAVVRFTTQGNYLPRDHRRTA